MSGCATGANGASDGARPPRVGSSTPALAPTSAESAVSPVSAPSAHPTSLTHDPAPPKKTAAAGEVTLRGTPREGVEHGCVVFAADDGVTYELMGGDRTLMNGESRLEVTGRIRSDLASYCQQGPILEVTSMRAI
jgi:hypothetical protein